jgi:hypothetical protein
MPIAVGQPNNMAAVRRMMPSTQGHGGSKWQLIYYNDSCNHTGWKYEW